MTSTRTRWCAAFATAAVCGAAMAGTPNHWSSPVSGDWGTAMNWSLGVVPDNSSLETFDAVIGAAGTAYVVRVNGGYTVDSVAVGPDATLAVLDDRSLLFKQGGITLNGGTIRMEGAGSVAAVLGTAASGEYASTIGGTGRIVFDGPTVNHENPPTNQITVADLTTLTIAQGVVVKTGTGNGVLGNGFSSQARLVNKGVISAETDIGRIVLTGRWRNEGTLRTANGGYLILDGTFGTADIGQLEQAGGEMVAAGQWDNTGGDYQLSGNWRLRGTIQGGRLRGSVGARIFVGDGGTAEMRDVMLDSDITVQSGTLLVTGTTRLRGSLIRLDSLSGITHVEFRGDHVVDSDTQFVFDTYFGSVYSVIGAEEGTLTLGPGVLARTGMADGVVGSLAPGTNNHLINQGTISARTPGRKVRVVTEGTVASPGTLEAINGGTLVTKNLIGELGNVVVGPGSGIELRAHPQIGMTNSRPRAFGPGADVLIGGKWTNTAPISITEGKLTLYGPLTNSSTIDAVRSQVMLASSNGLNLGSMTLTDSTLEIVGKMTPPQIAAITFVDTPVTVTGLIEPDLVPSSGVTLTKGSGDWLIRGGVLRATPFESSDGTGLTVVLASRPSAFEYVVANVPVTVQSGARLNFMGVLNGVLKNAGTITVPRVGGATLVLGAGSENTGSIVIDGSYVRARGESLKSQGSVRVASAGVLDSDSAGWSVEGTVRIDPGGSLIVWKSSSFGELDVGGSVRLGDISARGGRMTVKELRIDGSPGAWTGKVNVGDGALAIDYGPAAGSPLGTVIDQLRTARGPAGAWNGSGGITSTRAAVSSTSTLGYAEAREVLGIVPGQKGTWRDIEVDATTLLVGYVRHGDANLDGRVEFQDLVALAQNYRGTAGTGVWWRGDFNYDAVVDFADLVLLAQNYGAAAAPDVTGLGPVFAADAELAFEQARVPEPGVFGIAMFAITSLGMRRAGRRSRVVS